MILVRISPQKAAYKKEDEDARRALLYAKMLPGIMFLNPPYTQNAFKYILLVFSLKKFLLFKIK